MGVKFWNFEMNIKFKDRCEILKKDMKFLSELWNFGMSVKFWNLETNMKDNEYFKANVKFQNDTKFWNKYEICDSKISVKFWNPDSKISVKFSKEYEISKWKWNFEVPKWIQETFKFGYEFQNWRVFLKFQNIDGISEWDKRRRESTRWGIAN